MARKLYLSIALVLALAADAGAQIASPPVNAPGQPAGGAAPAPEAAQRNSTFDGVLAFSGVALVLLVVCYPSRRN